MQLAKVTRGDSRAGFLRKHLMSTNNVVGTTIGYGGTEVNKNMNLILMTLPLNGSSSICSDTDIKEQALESQDSGFKSLCCHCWMGDLPHQATKANSQFPLLQCRSNSNCS